MQLEDHITLEQFSQLMETFHKRGKHRKSQGTTTMPTVEFRHTLSDVLHRPEHDEKITLLCNKVTETYLTATADKDLCTENLYTIDVQLCIVLSVTMSLSLTVDRCRRRWVH